MIVLIPAKSTSHRVPRKNLQPLSSGMTLLDWCICLWKELLPGARIVVATDSAESAEDAIYWGCDIFPLTPADVNNARNANDLFEEFHQDHSDGQTVLAQCTSPFTFKSEVDLALLAASGRSAVRSGFVSVRHRHETGQTLSEDLRPEIEVTGNFLIATGDIRGVDWTCDEVISPVGRFSSLDINTISDLQLARLLASRVTLEDLLCN